MTVRSASRLENALGAVGLVALVAGLAVIPPTLAWDAEGAVEGIVSQLGITSLAAGATVLASSVDLLAGAVLARLAIGRAFRSVSELVLAGFAGAVLLDLLLLFVLAGPLGLFRAPVLAAIFATLLLIGWRSRPMLASRPTLVLRPSLLWVLIGIAWSGPILLQLASPVVPFLDVLPNHVAPVEHLRVFGSFDPLTTSPSPIYGPSRLSLGYVALLGTVTTLTGLPAALSASAFICVEVTLVALAVHYLAGVAGGRSVAVWALLLFTLTQPFARLTDDRSRILALALAAMTLAVLLGEMRRAAGPSRLETRPSRIIFLGAILGATFLMHAVIGALTAATVLLAALLAPSRSAVLIAPVLIVAAALALPQAAVMLGIELPAVAGLIVLPLAAAGLALGTRHRAMRATRRLAGLGLAATAVGTIGLLAMRTEALADALSLLPPGALLAASLVGLILVRRRLTRLVLGAGLAIGALASIVAYVVPSGGDSTLLASVRFEVPKEIRTWLPLFLALYAASAVAIALRWTALRRRARRSLSGLTGALVLVLVGALVVVAALPMRAVPIDALHVGEHRISESLAIALRFAERGYWTGYPDSRQLVDAEQEQTLDVLRGEIAKGNIDGSTRLLHVAASYHQWASVPIGVFTGIRETLASDETEESIHTEGGRLYPLSAVDEFLAQHPPRFDYVVLEPDGLPPSLEDRIVLAGYQKIADNGRALVFRTTPEPAQP